MPWRSGDLLERGEKLWVIRYAYPFPDANRAVGKRPHDVLVRHAAGESGGEVRSSWGLVDGSEESRKIPNGSRIVSQTAGCR